MLLMLSITLALAPAFADSCNLLAIHDFLAGATQSDLGRILCSELSILAIILSVLNLVLTM